MYEKMGKILQEELYIQGQVAMDKPMFTSLLIESTTNDEFGDDQCDESDINNNKIKSRKSQKLSLLHYFAAFP
jgi:hypothetical protein